jgi:hypothetical protein
MASARRNDQGRSEMIDTKLASRAVGLFSLLLLLVCVAGCGEDDPGPAPIVAPTAPANLQATALTYSTVELTWQDQSTNEEGFKILRGPDAGSVAEVASVDAGVTSYIDHDLDDSTAYYYRVDAYNSVGSTPTVPGAAATTYLKRSYQLIDRFMGTGAAILGGNNLPPLETGLFAPVDLTWGPDGKAYVVDWQNHLVRVFDGTLVHNLTGVGGETSEAPAGLADTSKFNHPTHVAFDPQGNLILSAWHNSKIMRMDMSTRWIAPICGTGARCWDGDAERPAGPALLNLPVSTAFDSQGNMYILDMANQRIRVVDLFGNINTVLGATATQACTTSCPGPIVGTLCVFAPSYAGDEGPAIDARIGMPVGQMGDPSGRLETDSNGNIYIADALNHRVRMIDGAGIIHTIAGNGTQTSLDYSNAGDDGPATDATLSYPSDIAVDSEGNVFIADTRNNCVRMVDTNGTIRRIAGVGGQNNNGSTGDGGNPRDAKLYRPYGVALDADENLYIADTRNNVIRVVYK